MRLAFLLPVLLSVAAPAHAERERESRYGPASPRQAIAAAVPYDGPMLSWAGKRQATAPVAAEPRAFAPPPIVDRPSYQPARYALPPPPAAALRPALPPAPPARRIASVDTDPPPVRSAPAPRAAPLPDSLYGPARAPVAAPAAVPTAPPPRQVAALNAPSSTGVVGARFYSVGREFGLTPDALPPAGPDRRVLITAGEAPPPPKDAAPLHGSADWLAAGARGDDQDDDDEGDKDDRRAKTRDKAL
ncbi:hypothetical protein [Caulobacter sp. LARHSG274]